MTTKAQSKRALTERESSKSHNEARAKKRALVTRKPRLVVHENVHAGKKASYALEDHAKGTRPARKSTRKASNHVKADANLNLREQRTKSAPEARSRRAIAQASRVRGHGGGKRL